MGSSDTKVPQVVVPGDRQLAVHLRNGTVLHVSPMTAVRIIRALCDGNDGKPGVLLTGGEDKAVAYMRLDAIDAAYWLEQKGTEDA